LKNKVWKVRVGNFLSKIKFGKLELAIWMKNKVWKVRVRILDEK
jgi:hypothetical protein